MFILLPWRVLCILLITLGSLLHFLCNALVLFGCQSNKSAMSLGDEGDRSGRVQGKKFTVGFGNEPRLDQESTALKSELLTGTFHLHQSLQHGAAPQMQPSHGPGGTCTYQ